MDVSLLGSSAAPIVSSLEKGNTISSSGNEAVARTAHQGDEGMESSAPKKRKKSTRKPRTKGLLKKLQDQVEFYFGDANLPKDKFLLQRMEENDGYVLVDVVAKFKKMQSLSTDSSLILKAIKNSSMLEISEDSKYMRRILPLPDVADSDVDLRTVYVENLSPTANHEAVKKIFRYFGEVTYVSLPRHKGSGVVKGFAFVEFSSQETAAKAVEYFKDKSTVPLTQRTRRISSKVTEEMIASEVVDSGDEKEKPVTILEDVPVIKEEEDHAVGEMGGLTREGTGDGDLTEGDRSHGETSEGGTDDPFVGGTSEEGTHPSEMEDPSGDGKEKRGTKRQRDDDGGILETEIDSDVGISSDSHPPHTKRPKQDDSKSEADVSLEGGKGEELREGQDDGDKQEGGEGIKKKKNRQHRKKQLTAEIRDLELRVMHKTEWIKLKEMFKSLQKSHMQQVKSIIKSSTSCSEAKPQSKRFVNDCLVGVELEEKWVESQKQKLQEFCKEFGEVAFIDLKDGDQTGYIRFRSSGCVEGLLKSENKPVGFSFSAVDEADERGYYLKTQAERKQNFMKGKKKQNQRGQDKLISRVLKKNVMKVTVDQKFPVNGEPKSTHIKFSSDSEQSDVER